MKKIILRLASFIGALAILLACAPKDDRSYFPQPHDGQHWEFRLDVTDPRGQTRTATLDVTVDGTEVLAGHTYLKHESIFSGLPGLESRTKFIRWAEDGIYSVLDRRRDHGEFFEVPLVVDVGDTWESNSPDGITHYRALAIEDVIAGGRTYEQCLNLFVSNGEMKLNRYYAKGIGIVKEVGDNYMMSLVE